jgi:hypothetical protein
VAVGKIVILLSTLAGSLLAGSAARHELKSESLASPVACAACWHPPLRVEWQWQLSGRLDTRPAVPLYDVDMFETSRAQVRQLHQLGRRVVCYVYAGSWEKWRPDAKQYPKSVLGKPLSGWPGERWVDVRKLSVLGPIISARVALCRKKGFDGVEFDNVDGNANPTGFRLTATDQLRFNVFLANLAHRDGLSAALKNDPDQARRLVAYFDFSLVEQCIQYTECGAFLPFIRAGKPVLEVEYKLPTSAFCRKANGMNFNAMKKRLELGPWRKPCR